MCFFLFDFLKSGLSAGENRWFTAHPAPWPLNLAVFYASLNLVRHHLAVWRPLMQTRPLFSLQAGGAYFCFGPLHFMRFFNIL